MSSVVYLSFESLAKFLYKRREWWSVWSG